MSPAKALLCAAALAQLALACTVRTDPPYSRYDYPPGGPSAGGAPSAGPSNVTPILVDIDTDKTMNASPGEGVGVFVEYASGGHWNVWWTCDTNVNTSGPVTCQFAVRVNVKQGVIAVQADAPAGRSILNPAANELDLATVTGAEIHGFRFDTDPGAVITIEASLAGQRDASYFFFVQNGQVNGGYKGALTNPLLLEGTKP